MTPTRPIMQFQRSAMGAPYARCGFLPGHRPAFSLIELMIAIVILGLGLIMVAAMFPIAWQRARVLNDQTMQSTITEEAENLARLLLKVDSSTSNFGSFAGDLMIDETGGFGEFVVSDTRVHSLHVENILVSPRAYYPPRDDAAKSLSPPWKLGRFNVLGGIAAPFFYTVGAGAPQISFESRVFPPMSPRPLAGLKPDGTFVVPAFGSAAGSEVSVWDDVLDAHRYALSIFHKLRTITTADKIDSAREFDMYYVALRRSKPTARYAQQDPDPLKVANPSNRKLYIAPAALPEAQDVMFPVPWRVQVFFPSGSGINARADTTGVPTVVEVNSAAFTPNAPPFVLDLFQEGAFFIDELNGQVYRVTDRRIIPPAAGTVEQAFLTLDREVFIEDLDDAIVNMAVDDDEQLRAVWVFPPPYAERDGNDQPLIDGRPPVIGIDSRTLTVAPRP